MAAGVVSSAGVDHHIPRSNQRNLVSRQGMT